MDVRVNLPSGALISCRDFCQAIARAICPAGEEGIEGIDCIVGKTMKGVGTLLPSKSSGSRWPPVSIQTVLTSNDGRTLEQLLVRHDDAATEEAQLLLPESVPWAVYEQYLPCELNDADRRILEQLLPQLPPLRYPISDDDAAAFISAYINLRGRPEWMPRLVTAATIERRKAEQAKVMRDHQEALQEEVANGRMAALDGRHARVAALSIGCHFTREEAIGYLDRHGMAHRSLETDGAGAYAEPPQLEVPPEPSCSEEVAVGKPRLSKREREQVVARHAMLMKSGVTNPTMQTAQKFDISERYVRELVKKSKPHSAIDQFVAATKKK